MRTILFLCLFCVAACLGCGVVSSKGFPVSGVVSFSDGKPVSYGQVTLTSGSFSVGGDIISDGTYNISRVGGVPAGTYKVSVVLSDPNAGMENTKKAKPQIDPKYNDPSTSGLTCEVTGATTYDITVEPPKK
ncbi:MAG: carboxypeptidase-like regulatory domain-containing protein [Planctomycetaceae bacterium]|jgi:hypothetical protein|nr:carboxypeptidase-like regulatory domain-containing protein [Planctomycetaceae bacterium]